MSIRFADITAPVDPSEFLSRFWTKHAVHLRQPDRTFDGVFGWDGLNAILNAHDLTFPKVKVSRNDSPVPAEKFTTELAGQRFVDRRAVLDLFQDGASVGITGADSHWAPLRAVVDCVYDALLESVHANVYCSPANTQGFHCHFDLHEVFVLQVEGTKHWRVFRPTTESPIESWRAADSPHESTEPYLDVVLQKGDVLYVPRGHWHYAVAEDSISVHVTVGVTCRKGTALLDWLAGELTAEAVWRRNAPLMDGATSHGSFVLPQDFSSWVEELTRSMARKMADPDLLERFCKATLRGILPSRSVDMSIQSNGSGLPIEELVFERPMGRRHVIVDNGDSAVTVSAADCEIQLEDVDAELLRKIFAADSFTASDIRNWQPDVPLDEVGELLAELIRQGLLIAHQRRL